MVKVAADRKELLPSDGLMPGGAWAELRPRSYGMAELVACCDCIVSAIVGASLALNAIRAQVGRVL